MFNPRPDEAAIFRRFLTQSEQPRLLNTIKRYSSVEARRDHAVCRLLIGSGMRITECLKITTGDAADALQCGYLFIPKEHRKKSGGKKAEDNKPKRESTSIDLSVTLTKSVRAALYDLLILREGAGVDEALIVSRKSGGKAMTVRGFELRVAYWAKLSGLPEGVSPHWLRHTHAKNIMRESEAADPLRVAQLSLGQRSRRSTEIYTRLDREEFEAALHHTDRAVFGQPRIRIAQLRKQYERRAGV